MSDEKQSPRGDFDELEPMDELEELEELAELEEFDELEPAPTPVHSRPPVPPRPEVPPRPPVPPRSPVQPPPVAKPTPPPPPPPVRPTPSPAPTPAVTPAAAVEPSPPMPTPSAPMVAPTPSPSSADSASTTSASITELDTASAASNEPAAAGAKSGPGERPNKMAPGQKRELDTAPILLRKAALILLVGSIVPWGDAANPEVISTGLLWGGTIAEKAVLFLAVWLFYQSHVLKHGGASPLAALKPIGLMVLAGLLSIGGMYWWMTGVFLFPTFGEKILLLLGGFTWIHIYDYERGGKFNPIYPLLFLGAAITGLATIFEVVGDGPPGYAALLLGTIPVTIAGFMAMYTMVVSLKQAKIEGDIKKEAMLAARKAARGDRPSASRGPGAAGSGPGSPGASGGIVKRRDRS